MMVVQTGVIVVEVVKKWTDSEYILIWDVKD